MPEADTGCLLQWHMLLVKKLWQLLKMGIMPCLVLSSGDFALSLHWCKVVWWVLEGFSWVFCCPETQPGKECCHSGVLSSASAWPCRDWYHPSKTWQKCFYYLYLPLNETMVLGVLRTACGHLESTFCCKVLVFLCCELFHFQIWYHHLSYHALKWQESITKITFLLDIDDYILNTRNFKQQLQAFR